MTVDTKPAGASPDKETRHFHRRDPDPDFIRGWPIVHEGVEREPLVRRDAVGGFLAGRGDLEGKTLVGLRTAASKAIPVSAAYADVKH